jgi:glucan 1,3-beta-glucosidase
MHYAAWVSVPGSQLYHGAQAIWLQKITSYAIVKYGMRVAIGLHSLPGGVNDLDIGEAYGHDAWFYNSTNLDYSYKAIDAILLFIEASGTPWAFSISAINEASDNFAGFATPTGVTSNGTQYIVNYINGVISRTALVDKRIPTVLQDCFLGEEHWSPYFANTTNLVIDTHIYYFAASGIYSQYVGPAICGQASVAGGDKKFPVYIGEWSLQVLYNNTLSNRASIFNTQRYAWEKYVSGGSFWSSKFNGTTAVSGEGTQKDYWYYEGLIDAGVITSPISGATYC